MPQRRQKPAPRVSATHPLVGVWEETDNDFYRTKVVYQITVKRGRLHVSGVDESDGVALRVSGTNWDGRSLHFRTFFPPTNHTAQHEFRASRNGRSTHKVSYSDEDGTHMIREIWKRKSTPTRPRAKKALPSSQ